MLRTCPYRRQPSAGNRSFADSRQTALHNAHCRFSQSVSKEDQVYKQSYEASHAQKRAPLKTPYQIRQDLGIAYRLAVEFGWEEGVCNHFTHMLPSGHVFRPS